MIILIDLSFTSPNSLNKSHDSTSQLKNLYGTKKLMLMKNKSVVIY